MHKPNFKIAITKAEKWKNCTQIYLHLDGVEPIGL